jgi:uncharacterized protein (TIGR00255 family)
MSIQSMTGFARTSGSAGGREFAWEIRAVNGRSLDIKLRTPPGFDSVGEEARKRLGAQVARGSIHITLTISVGDGPRTIKLNTEMLTGLIASFAALKTPPGIGGVTLDGLLHVRGVLEQSEDDPLALLEAMQGPLLASFDAATAAFLASRKAEGQALKAVLDSQLAQIAQFTTSVSIHPGRTTEAIKARMAGQVALLLEASHQLDEARLHQEAALLATKADVREEIDRLEAHVAAAREMITTGGAVGRRLDFLAQEFGRESSTLCAKANDVTMSRIGLELRAVVDQLREQVQNVE